MYQYVLRPLEKWYMLEKAVMKVVNLIGIEI